MSKLQNEHGASAVEYSLVTGLIAAVISTTITVFGTVVKALFQSFLDQAPF